MVKSFLIQNLRKVRLYLLIIVVVPYVRADVIHHLHDHNIGSSMLRSL